MNVKELIEKLQNMDPNAHVVISGDVVRGIEQRTGQYKKDYYNDTFILHRNGKNNAILFTKYTEFSDGIVDFEII